MIEAAYDRMNEEEADSPERTWAVSSFRSIAVVNKQLGSDNIRVDVLQPVKNLDEFCSNVYMYYIENGFWCIVLKRITKLM